LVSGVNESRDANTDNGVFSSSRLYTQLIGCLRVPDLCAQATNVEKFINKRFPFSYVDDNIPSKGRDPEYDLSFGDFDVSSGIEIATQLVKHIPAIIEFNDCSVETIELFTNTVMWLKNLLPPPMEQSSSNLSEGPQNVSKIRANHEFQDSAQCAGLGNCVYCTNFLCFSLASRPPHDITYADNRFEELRTGRPSIPFVFSCGTDDAKYYCFKLQAGDAVDGPYHKNGNFYFVCPGFDYVSMYRRVMF